MQLRAHTAGRWRIARITRSGAVAARRARRAGLRTGVRAALALVAGPAWRVGLRAALALVARRAWSASRSHSACLASASWVMKCMTLSFGHRRLGWQPFTPATNGRPRDGQRAEKYLQSASCAGGSSGAPCRLCLRSGLRSDAERRPLARVGLAWRATAHRQRLAGYSQRSRRQRWRRLLTGAAAGPESP